MQSCDLHHNQDAEHLGVKSKYFQLYNKPCGCGAQHGAYSTAHLKVGKILDVITRKKILQLCMVMDINWT